DAQPTGVGGQHSCEDSKQGGLARAVRAQQPGDAGVEVERHPVEGPGAPVGLGDVGDADGGLSHNALLTSRAARRRTSTTAETATATRHPTWPVAWKAARRSWAAPALATATAIHTAATAAAAASGVSHVARARLAKVSPRDGSSHAAAVQSRTGRAKAARPASKVVIASTAAERSRSRRTLLTGAAAATS